MSRTFRRKNWEDTQRNSWSNFERKKYGFYGARHQRLVLFRQRVLRLDSDHRKYSIDKLFWDIHSDNHQSQWTPSKWYRRKRNKQNRMISRQELNKYKKLYYYEVMAEANPRSHLRDWY